MIRLPLWGEDDFLLLAPRFSDLTPAAQITVLGLLLLAPAALVLWLYWYEMRLVRVGMALTLLGIRSLLLLLLWAVVAWQPVIIEEPRVIARPPPPPPPRPAPSRVLLAVDRSSSMEIADPPRTMREKVRLARTFGMAERAMLDNWLGELEKDPAATREKAWAAQLAPEQRQKLDALLGRIDGWTRAQICRKILDIDGLELLTRLQRTHAVELLAFDRTASEQEGLESLLKQKADVNSPSTDLRAPLAHGIEHAVTDRGELAAIILLSDGQHNAGASPLVQAGELGRRHVPVYALALGNREPPADIALLEVKAPANVFKDTDVPIDVRIKVTGMAAQEIVVEMDGANEDARGTAKIRHDGKDRVYPVALQARFAAAGIHPFRVQARAADAKAREVTLANNALPGAVRVTEDKARILLVDGEARWEYHYLASALLRDKTMTLDRVLFLQPRLKQIAEEKLEKLGNPRLRLPELKPGQAEDPLGRYDCIILGDVLPEHLPNADRLRIEKFVDNGGTLVLLAGKRAMPLEYAKAGDPFFRLLPVLDPRVVDREKGFAVTLSAEGARTSFLHLESPPEKSAERWAELPRHFWAIVGRAKPGAEPLAYLDEELTSPSVEEKKTALERRQGLIVRQNYGFGRVLFVGVDSTWRWRYRVGDTYHHRFWSQVIRWAASDKLLPAGNALVRYGSRQPVYRQGTEVEIAVRLNEGAPLLSAKAHAVARLVLENKDPVSVLLTPSKTNPRLLEGRKRDLAAGTYRVELDIPELKASLQVPPGPEEAKSPRRDAFTVLPAATSEMLDLAANWKLLEQIAAQSKGKLFTVENASQIADLLAEEVESRKQKLERERKAEIPQPSTPDSDSRNDLDRIPRHLQQRLWQDPPLVWWLLAIFLTLLTIEWVLRKWAELP